MEQNIKDALNERVITEAGSRFGVKREDIKTLGGFENFVYEYEKNGELFILRLNHCTHQEEKFVQAELEFIDYLSKNGAKVSNVVLSSDGNLIEKIQDDLGGYFSACVFEKAPGTFVKREDLTSDFFEYFGKEVGKLHRLTKSYKPVTRRYEWHEEDWIDIGRRSLKEEDMFMIDIALNHVKKLESYETDVDSYGLIHTDLHFGNMFYHNNELTFFDWDDSSYKHFISDIAIIIFYTYGMGPLSDAEIEQKAKYFLTHFMKGYNKENKLNKVWFERLNDFFKLRELILYFVLHAAGESVINGPFGKRFFGKFRDRIINNTPFFNLDNVIDEEPWNL